MSPHAVLLLSVTLILAGLAESEICFEKIGCLKTSYPWSNFLRQVPPPLSPDELPIKLNFFSRDSQSGQFSFAVYPDVNIYRAPFNPSRPTVIITHDANVDSNDPWMYTLKDAYLQRVDANVIILDWTEGEVDFDLGQSAANARVVAKVVARFLRIISNLIGLSPNSIHLIGEGLGAHLMSYVANDFKGIGRITGLDPTRKHFAFQHHMIRLDPSDAIFVDVVHTDANLHSASTEKEGVLIPAGHVDFYPNGGKIQPGCVQLALMPKITSLGQLPNVPKKMLITEETCNHKRAREYYLEAVTDYEKCIFWGHKISPLQLGKSIFNWATDGHLAALTRGICTDFHCTPLGLETPHYPARGWFLFTTRRKPPYCIKNLSFSLIKHIAPIERMADALRQKLPFLQKAVSKEERPLP